MTVNKPYSFVAGTKARAEEVNTDFDVLYTQVNTNISDIAKNKTNIENLDSNKADLHGSASNTFAVGNPESYSDAINKQTFFKQIANVVNYIGGLTITRSNSNTIIVDPGACYDRNGEVILKLGLQTSKQNTSQSASTRYYVYIVSDNANGTNPSIVISANSVQPGDTPPTLYRKIGSYTTNSSNNIDSVQCDSGDSSKIDGSPINSYQELSSGTSATTYTIDLYNILPKDGYRYMVYLVAAASDSGTYTVLQTVTSDIWGGMPGINVVGGYADKSRSWFEIPAKRYLYYTISHSVSSAHLWLIGYRRIGTNI